MKVKQIINLILAAIGLAMGVAVVVLTVISSELNTDNLVRMLGIAAVSFGILALNKVRGSE